MPFKKSDTEEKYYREGYKLGLEHGTKDAKSIVAGTLFAGVLIGMILMWSGIKL